MCVSLNRNYINVPALWVCLGSGVQWCVCVCVCVCTHVHAQTEIRSTYHVSGSVSDLLYSGVFVCMCACDLTCSIQLHLHVQSVAHFTTIGLFIYMSTKTTPSHSSPQIAEQASNSFKKLCLVVITNLIHAGSKENCS